MRAPRYLYGIFWWGLTCLELMAGTALSLTDKPEAGIPMFGMALFNFGIVILWLVNWVIYSIKEDS